MSGKSDESEGWEKTKQVGAYWVVDKDDGEDSGESNNNDGSASAVGNEDTTRGPLPRYLIDEVKDTVVQRGASYGHPTLDFYRIAQMWSGMFREYLRPGVVFKPQDVAKAIICLKLSRSMNREDQDNILDTMGYAHCWDLINRNPMRGMMAEEDLREQWKGENFIGQMLLRLRRNLSITRSELALMLMDRFELPTEHRKIVRKIRSHELGKHIPTIYSLYQYSEIFHVSIDTFFADKSDGREMPRESQSQ